MVLRRSCQEESTEPDVCQVKPVPGLVGLNARKRRTPPYWAVPCQADSVSALASDPRTVGAAPPGWHGLPSYIPYYNRRDVLTCTASRRGGGIWYALEVLRARVCSPACRRRYYSRLFWSSIVGGKIGAIAGKAAVKPRALFCGVGGIIALTRQNTL